MTAAAHIAKRCYLAMALMLERLCWNALSLRPRCRQEICGRLRETSLRVVCCARCRIACFSLHRCSCAWLLPWLPDEQEAKKK